MPYRGITRLRKGNDRVGHNGPALRPALSRSGEFFSQDHFCPWDFCKLAAEGSILETLDAFQRSGALFCYFDVCPVHP